MIKTKEQLKEYLDSQDYDKYYQDIEILDFIGYSKSYESWKTISELGVDWKDKTICDLGCFHAYFGIKVMKEGAKKVIGLDATPPVIPTAKFITEFSGVDMEFLQWVGGEETPKCDIALCLNMLHHCENQDLTLSKMNCDYAVFEINPDQKELVEKYFETVIQASSHRENSADSATRIILYMRKKV